jgi:hypothetical protein
VKVRLDVKRAWCVDGWIRKWNFGSITMHVGPSEHINFQHKRTSHLPPHQYMAVQRKTRHDETQSCRICRSVLLDAGCWGI